MADTQERFRGPDGVEYVSIIVTTNRPFAEACIAAWDADTGGHRGYMLQHKAVSVPTHLMPRAREILKQRERDESDRGNGGGNG